MPQISGTSSLLRCSPMTLHGLRCSKTRSARSQPADPNLSWIEGQVSPSGTQIDLVVLTFVPQYMWRTGRGARMEGMEAPAVYELWTRSLGSEVSLDALDPAASYGGPDSVLGAGSAWDVATAASDAAPLSPESLPGDASFRVGAQIGEGGMGVVFRAEQQRLGREVALKRLKRATPQARSAFLSEAWTVACLDHPNIVPVYDLELLDAGGAQLAMKLVEGTSWRARLDAGGESLERHLATLTQVAHGVAFAHSRGLVHCDLKPANVLLGTYGEVIIADWGLALAFDDRPRPLPLARSAALRAPRGTPAYMAPELALGQGERIGPATDVYLLGGVLYRLLAGRPPHAGALFADVLAAASEARWAPLPEEVPDELRGICARALSREPGERFADAAAFRDALEAYRQHRESLALTRAARARLDELRERPDGERTALYDAFAETAVRFRQAAELWEGNRDATSGERETRRLYAEAALARGDLGVVAGQLERLAGSAEHAPLAAELGRARAAQERERRGRRRLRRMLGVALACLLLGLGGGLAAFVSFNRQLSDEVAAKEQARGELAEKNEALAAQVGLTEQARSHAEHRGDVAERALTGLATQVQDILLRNPNAELLRPVASQLVDTALQGFAELRDTDLAAERFSLATVRVQHFRVELLLLTERLDRAREELAVAAQILAALEGDVASDELVLERAETRFLEHEILFQAGEREAARAALVELLAALPPLRAVPAVATRAGRLLVRGHAALGSLCYRDDDLPGALESFETCLALIDSYRDVEADVDVRVQTSIALEKIALVVWRRGEPARARELFLQVQRARMGLPNDNLRDLANLELAYRNRGRIELELGTLDSAGVYLERAEALAAHLFENDPLNRERALAVALIGFHRGELALARGALPLAVERFGASFEAAAVLCAEDPANTELAMHRTAVAMNACDTLIRAKHYAEALGFAEAALASHEELVALQPDAARDLGQIHQRLDWLRKKLGRSE